MKIFQDFCRILTTKDFQQTARGFCELHSALAQQKSPFELLPIFIAAHIFTNKNKLVSKKLGDEDGA